MLLKVIVISVVLLAIMFLGIAFKLLFDKNAKLPANSCNSLKNSGNGSSCGCGGIACLNEQGQQENTL